MATCGQLHKLGAPFAPEPPYTPMPENDSRDKLRVIAKKLKEWEAGSTSVQTTEETTDALPRMLEPPGGPVIEQRGPEPCMKDEPPAPGTEIASTEPTPEVLPSAVKAPAAPGTETKIASTLDMEPIAAPVRTVPIDTRASSSGPTQSDAASPGVSPPSPTPSVDEQSLADELYKEKRPKQARLVEFMIGRTSADFADLADHVHDNSRTSDDAVEKNARNASDFAVTKDYRVKYQPRCGKVFKVISPE